MQSIQLKDGYVWSCSRNGVKKDPCFNVFSIRKGSFFSGTHISESFATIILIIYYWIIKLPLDTLREELRIGSQHTSTDWYQFCRDICGEVILDDSKQGIGGEGHTVEIDESKFGKRKYNRGKRVEGQWVFGGIDTETKGIFLIPCPENKRNADTLIPLIERWIKPGTTIISDFWKAYDKIDETRFNHLKVNYWLSYENTCLCVVTALLLQNC